MQIIIFFKSLWKYIEKDLNRIPPEKLQKISEPLSMCVFFFFGLVIGLTIGHDNGFQQGVWMHNQLMFNESLNQSFNIDEFLYYKGLFE